MNAFAERNAFDSREGVREGRRQMPKAKYRWFQMNYRFSLCLILNLPLVLERCLLETMILYYKLTGLSVFVTKLYLKVVVLQKICKKNLNWVCVHFCLFFLIYQGLKFWYQIFLLLKVDVACVFLAVAL